MTRNSTGQMYCLLNTELECSILDDWMKRILQAVEMPSDHNWGLELEHYHEQIGSFRIKSADLKRNNNISIRTKSLFNHHPQTSTLPLPFLTTGPQWITWIAICARRYSETKWLYAKRASFTAGWLMGARGARWACAADAGIATRATGSALAQKCQNSPALVEG